MATRAEHSLVINQPVEKVYAFVSDVKNNPKWQVGILETRTDTDGPTHVGTKVTDVRTFVGRKMELSYEVVEMVPNSTLSLKSLSGPLAFHGTTTLQDMGEVTRVHVTFEMEATGILKLAEGLVASSLKKDLETSFAQLKVLLESQ